MSLYFIILLSSVAVPLVLSFDKNVRFYTRWKYLFPALLIVATVYIIFDIFFTKAGIWGFNDRYLSSVKILGLPIEEILFFIIIPYCSIFLYDTIEFYFPKIRLTEKYTRIVSYFLLLVAFVLVLKYYDKAYAVYMALSFSISVIIGLYYKNPLILQRYYLVFILITVPFMLVNGLLTGSYIEEEVVWYNNNENMAIRLFTIPVEDFGYGFGLILFNLLLSDWFKRVFTKKI